MNASANSALMAASNACNFKYNKGEINHLKIKKHDWICSSE
jgi:hypothetical protein